MTCGYSRFHALCSLLRLCGGSLPITCSIADYPTPAFSSNAFQFAGSLILPLVAYPCLKFCR